MHIKCCCLFSFHFVSFLFVFSSIGLWFLIVSQCSTKCIYMKMAYFFFSFYFFFAAIKSYIILLASHVSCLQFTTLFHYPANFQFDFLSFFLAFVRSFLSFFRFVSFQSFLSVSVFLGVYFQYFEAKIYNAMDLVSTEKYFIS